MTKKDIVKVEIIRFKSSLNIGNGEEYGRVKIDAEILILSA